ncbi:hypothetical protein QR685DRAFT_529486 [Neurospora intermedia]|uniref:Secreted protein n=1 Tax=Neurospora intermedia TaxID=5142 RepID=A0ABR3D8L3_NEUIN
MILHNLFSLWHAILWLRLVAAGYILYSKYAVKVPRHLYCPCPVSRYIATCNTQNRNIYTSLRSTVHPSPS